MLYFAMEKWKPTTEQLRAFKGLKNRFPDKIGYRDPAEYIEINPETGHPYCTVVDTQLVATEAGAPTPDGKTTIHATSYCATCLFTGKPFQQNHAIVVSDVELAKALGEMHDVEFTFAHEKKCPFPQSR